MRAIDYALRQAWASLWRSRASTAFAVLAIALAAMVLGTLLLVTWNVDRVMTQWTDATEFSIFLRDDATSEQRGSVEATIEVRLDSGQDGACDSGGREGGSGHGKGRPVA